MLLQISNLEVSYHKKQVIFGISLAVEEGKIVSLVGPNGAGKTTVFNLISGQLPVDQGEILFKGRNITSLPPRFKFRGADRLRNP